MYTAVSAAGFTAVFVDLTPALTFTFTKYLHLSSFEIAEKISFASIPFVALKVIASQADFCPNIAADNFFRFAFFSSFSIVCCVISFVLSWSTELVVKQNYKFCKYHHSNKKPIAKPQSKP